MNVVALAVVTALLSQSPPVPLGRPDSQIHVLVTEDIDPDVLNLLARPRVTLWMSTRSNLLKASILERLHRFDRAFVEMRAPVSELHTQQFRVSSSVGPWLDGSALSDPTMKRWLGRRVAVRITGPLTDSESKLVRTLKPSHVHWEPTPEHAHLAAWGQFLQLPGEKLVALPPAAGAEPCQTPIGATRARAFQVWMEMGQSARWSGCALNLRARIRPDVSDAELRDFFARHPTAELELNVGNDEQQARRVRHLIERLSNPHRAP